MQRDSPSRVSLCLRYRLLLAFAEHTCLAAQEPTSTTAMQAERFACLYTSHVANLALYSPYKCYRGRMDSLAHEEEPVFGGGLPPSLDP